MFDSGHEEPTEAGPVEQVLSACVSAVGLALETTSQLDLTHADGVALRRTILALEQARTALDATCGHALVELDDQRAPLNAMGMPTSKWLAREAGLPPGVAKQRLAMARKLRDELPELDDALVAGQVSFEQARVIADAVNERNITVMRPLLGQIIDDAATTTFHRWRRDTQALGRLLDADGPHDPSDDWARNVLRLSDSDDLSLLKAELCGDAAVAVSQGLNRVADELFLAWTKDCAANPELQMPTRPMLLAQALVELVRRGQSVPVGDSRPPQVDVTLVMNENSPLIVTDPCGSPFPASTLPVFLCDPHLHTVLIDSLGLPVNVGRDTRIANATQRRALAVRDGGCTFPGCDARIAWTDAHHTRHWHRDRGPSDLDNFALVCRRHHGVAHRTGWNVTLQPDGWTLWTTPTGRTFSGQQHHRQRTDPPATGPP